MPQLIKTDVSSERHAVVRHLGRMAEQLMAGAEDDHTRGFIDGCYESAIDFIYTLPTSTEKLTAKRVTENDFP